MILQKNKKPCDFLRNKFKISGYNCYYCSETVNLEEILKIDKKLKRMAPEKQEFLLDNLPSSSNPREPPFIHECDLGYDVLNICIECFKNARNKYQNNH